MSCLKRFTIITYCTNPHVISVHAGGRGFYTLVLRSNCLQINLRKKKKKSQIWVEVASQLNFTSLLLLKLKHTLFLKNGKCKMKPCRLENHQLFFAFRRANCTQWGGRQQKEVCLSCFSFFSLSLSPSHSLFLLFDFLSIYACLWVLPRCFFYYKPASTVTDGKIKHLYTYLCQNSLLFLIFFVHSQSKWSLYLCLTHTLWLLMRYIQTLAFTQSE